MFRHAYALWLQQLCTTGAAPRLICSCKGATQSTRPAGCLTPRQCHAELCHQRVHARHNAQSGHGPRLGMGSAPCSSAPLLSKDSALWCAGTRLTPAGPSCTCCVSLGTPGRCQHTNTCGVQRIVQGVGTDMACKAHTLFCAGWQRKPNRQQSAARMGAWGHHQLPWEQLAPASCVYCGHPAPATPRVTTQSVATQASKGSRAKQTLVATGHKHLDAGTA